jgi:hypothetical protein
MIVAGLVITGATVVALLAGFLRRRTRALPTAGWVGLAGLAGVMWMLHRGDATVSTFFTPIMWTFYILFADSAVYSITGHSRLRDAPGEFALAVLLSIPLWMIFEAYNLRMVNWEYVGLPASRGLRWFGYAWSFATITPGILETADLIRASGWFRGRREPVHFSRGTSEILTIAGLAALILPLAVPRSESPYLFFLVWLGFVFLLDPVNHALGLPSILGDFEEGNRQRFYSLLASGWVCGWLWESWNYWASAKWKYIFPILQHWKIFEMPVPGFVGFLPFAVECFTMYVTASWLVRLLFSMPEAGPRNEANSG